MITRKGILPPGIARPSTPSQPELARLLYPLLIYCYLDLVGKGATAQAHKMMTKAQRRFVQGQPQGKARLQVCLTALG